MERYEICIGKGCFVFFCKYMVQFKVKKEDPLHDEITVVYSLGGSAGIQDDPVQAFQPSQGQAETVLQTSATSPIVMITCND